MSELSKLEKNLIIKKIDDETINIKILDNNILLSIIGVFNANLIDEIHVFLMPLILSSGIEIFEAIPKEKLLHFF